MIAQRIWALIDKDEVKNIIVCDDYPTADMLAKDEYGSNSFAVEVTQIPTGIGHTYEEGVFKNIEGEEIEPLPTQEEEVKMLQRENSLLKERASSTEEALVQLMMEGGM